MMTQSSYTGSDTKYTKCTACADNAHDTPGICVGCETGYHVITGEETGADLNQYLNFGICTTNYPCSDPSTYYTLDYDTCESKISPGGSCSSSSAYKCTSGMCNNGICCDQAAATPVDGQCCTLCSTSDGSCLEREACAPCMASGAIANGVAPPCSSSLTSGTSCEPTCNAGYALTGSRSCDAGTLNATAKCIAMVCDTEQYWNGDSCEACATGTTSAGGSTTT